MRAEGPSACNISTACLAHGPLDLAALSAAIADVVERHEVLRAGVRNQRGEPRTMLGAWPRMGLDVVELSAHPDAEAAFRADARALESLRPQGGSAGRPASTRRTTEEAMTVEREAR